MAATRGGSGAGEGERRSRNAQDTKKRILDAAEEEFAAKGFDGARLGSIAAAASVQQALIHHYFIDKAGLYREVIDRALGAITSEGWDILARTVSNVSKSDVKRERGSGLHLTHHDARPLVDAFVELLQRFFNEHGHILSIVRHEANGGSTMALDVVRARVKPVVDAVVAYLEALRGAGQLRADVDVRQLTISAVSMVAFPAMEKGLLGAVWPLAVRDAKHTDAVRREIVDTLVMRLLP
ncbi:MAG TPA: TetR family transcriptional regulator [Polyangiaceae bacterium]